MTDEKHPTSAEDGAEALKHSFAVIGAELCDLLHKVAPAEAQAHFRSAHVEALKGLRVLIDRRIERLSAERTKGTAIEVELEAWVGARLISSG